MIVPPASLLWYWTLPTSSASCTRRLNSSLHDMVIYQIATFHRIKTVFGLPAIPCLHRGALHLRPFSQLAGSFNKSDPWLFECRIDAEPIYRYTKGGYHPVHLGDILNNGTYRILHNIGKTCASNFLDDITYNGGMSMRDLERSFARLQAFD